MRWLLIAGVSLLAIWLVAIVVLVLLGRKSLARELTALLPNVVRLFRGLLGDERVPRSSKVLLLFGAAWLASPVDLIPEFLPVIGPLDDVLVVALALRYAARRVPRAVLTEAWPGDPRLLERLLGGPAPPTG
jgi:uncharacterized membrane protein YkvA (DUF1232 family)